MEIAQDQLNPSTFYLLLVPSNEIGGTQTNGEYNGASVDGVGSTTTTQTDPTFSESSAANLATIVQITETLNNFTDSAQGGQ